MACLDVLLHLLAEGHAVHAFHHHVGNYQVDVGCFQDVECLSPVGRLVNVVGRRKGGGEILQEVDVVFDQEQGLSVLAWGCFVLGCCCLYWLGLGAEGGRRGGGWEHDGKDAALRVVVFQQDVATQLLGELLDDGEPETAAFLAVAVLAQVERFEDVLLLVVADSSAVVCDADAQLVVGVLCVDGYLAAVLGILEGVGEQVFYHLGHFVGIGVHHQVLHVGFEAEVYLA